MHGTSERMAVTLAAGLIIAVKAGVLQIANYGRLAFEGETRIHRGHRDCWSILFKAPVKAKFKWDFKIFQN